MFFSSKQKANNKNSKSKNKSSSDSAVTILTAGCRFEGRLYCRGISRIGGKIEGEVISEGTLIIEEDALVEAAIQAEEVIIQGQVKGQLEASGKVELATSSHFQGSLSAKTLEIQEGANFNGNITMLHPEKTLAEMPVLSHEAHLKDSHVLPQENENESLHDLTP